MYSHAPSDYDCHFCAVAAGQNNPFPFTQQTDVIMRNEHITAFVAVAWWPNNAGNALVVPNRHIENIYELVPEVAVQVHEASRQIALAMKRAYGCDGISTRQHNEPAGNQHVWHYHLHVFPRYAGDRLYDLAHHHRDTTPEERLPYAEQLRTVIQQITADQTS